MSYEPIRITTVDGWTGAVNCGSGVNVILDFKKAFDSVPHCRMMKKLSGYGICGNLLNWLSNFIQHRQQRVYVVINGVCSNWINVKSGVPQGLVLGPLLFLLYVNDIPDTNSYSLIKLFADDVTAIQHPSDIVHLQHNIDLLNCWSQKWQLYLSISKCKFLSIGNSLDAAYTIIDPTTSDRVQLSQCSEEKDLGTWYTSD